ncbi:MAG: type III pantothenate kinase [SAR324 cluster bacterium]|nr:type III pantothenate kinase [SAR324 cluster bacterium]
MLLAFDIGNTKISTAVFQDSSIIHRGKFPSRRSGTAIDYQQQIAEFLLSSKISLSTIEDVIFSSVVPELSVAFHKMAQNLIGKKAIQVSPALNLGIRLDVDFPEKVGQDRIATAVAAYEMFHACVIVLDMGTATTIDLVSQDGIFQGGIICPGMGILSNVLTKNTSQLFQVPLEPPVHVIGKNTEDCLKSGIFFGYIGMIRSLIQQIITTLDESPVLVATGGIAAILKTHIPEIPHWIDDLLLTGLLNIYQKNRN